MKKYLGFILIIFVISLHNQGLGAQDLSPSDAYYKEHIAVNEISTEAPSLKGGGEIPNPGGESGGNGPWVGGSVGDAVYPLLSAGLLYGIFLMYKKRKSNV